MVVFISKTNLGALACTNTIFHIYCIRQWDAYAVFQEMQNPVTKMYFAFLTFIVPAVNKVNIEFQGTSLGIHKLCTSISSSLKPFSATLWNVTNWKTNLTHSSVSDPSNCLPLGDIYRGTKTESIYLEHSANIHRRDLLQFQIKTPNVYVALSKQMYKHFVSFNMLRNLELLQALDSINACQGKPKSLIPWL